MVEHCCERRSENMKVSDVMTREVVTTGPEASLEDAARLMVRHRVSGLPVVDEKQPVVGIVTEGDLLRRIELSTERPRAGWLTLLLAPGRVAQDYVRSHARKVGEIMACEVVSITADTSLGEVVALMEAQCIKRLPVLEKGRLIGIVSRADLLRALIQLLPEKPVAVTSDADLRRRVLAEIDRQPWAPRVNLDAVVKEGVVKLRGVITDDRERAGLRVIAENTPGVKGVSDHLVWIEPISGTVVDAPKAGQ
jgi:CBS domain-containing protein